jgi:hypothetical protein
VTVPYDVDDALAAQVMAGPASMDVPQPPVAAPAPEPEPVALPESDQLPEFDPRWREPFEGLTFLGHLDDDVIVWGHRFKIMTPSSAERLEMVLLTKEFDGTIGTEFAYAAGLVAAYLIRVDGTDLPRPIGNDPKETAVRDRWDWVLANLKKPVIDELFEACLDLDDTVRAVLDAMGKARG